MSYLQADLEVINHYSQFQGESATIWTFNDVPVQAPNPMYIVEYAPSSPEYDWIYLTVGMSRKPMPRISSDKPRIELMIYAREREEELAQALAKLAVYPFVNNTHFDVGHTISGQSGIGVVDNSPLTEFLLTPVYFEADGFDAFELSDGISIQVLWATPIYLSERNYVLLHGWRSLVEGPFIDKKVQPADLYRAAVV